MGVTGTWRRILWENADQATDNTIISRDLSGWWMPRDDLTLYAAYLKQDYGLFGQLGRTPYAADAESFVCGATCQLSDALSVDLSYTDSESWGPAGTDRHIISAGLNYLGSSGDEFSLNLVLDDFGTSENAPTWDYDADLFELRYTKNVSVQQ